MPRHIAIIMDGNGRWAKARKKNRLLGHRAGLEAVQKVVRACAEKSIEVLSLFAFSSENWGRPDAEVAALMELFAQALKRETRKLHQNNIRMRFIGERSVLSNKLQKLMTQAEQLTADNSGLQLIIAVNYGGRWDVKTALLQLFEKVKQGVLSPNDINEDTLGNHLATADIPEPDLFIRTSGEQRISNFYLWQLAYTELYFSELYWPDFNEEALDTAIQTYQSRQRRFGHVCESMEPESCA